MGGQRIEAMATTETSATLDECVRGEMARWTVPGVAVGILGDGQRELHGYGLASIETEQPVRPDTLFQIGSISKVYTTTLIMRLVDEGKLALDEPIITYVPDLKLADAQARETITLRHLLSHTSGLFGDYFDDFGMGDDALPRAIATFETLRQQFAPGALWTYCNTGFGLAGAIIERVTGQPFETAMRSRIFKLLGLKRSFYFAHEAIVYPNAVGHTQLQPSADEHEVARLYPLPRWVGAAGGIIANVNDLLTFAEFHLRDGKTSDGTQHLSAESAQAMRQEQTRAANFAEGYGLGWALRTASGEHGVVRIVEHGGSTIGFQAKLVLVPSRNFAIAFLTNSSRGSIVNEHVRAWALGHYLGLREERPTPQRLSEDELSRFAGRYERPEGAIILTTHDGGLIRAMTLTDPLDGKTEHFPDDRLEATGEREFVVVSNGDTKNLRVDFIMAEDGAPRFVRMGGRLADYKGQA
jgi:CubicO group peptidase (beta-lactamase class C family)